MHRQQEMAADASEDKSASGRDTGLVIPTAMCVGPSNSRWAEATRRGLRGLLKKQDEDGAWRDFDIPSVGSATAWVTAAVLVALKSSQWAEESHRIAEAASRAIASLRRNRQPCGTWGYNTPAGADCDSTAHVVIALRAWDAPIAPTVHAFLKAHQTRPGWFRTYISKRDGHPWGFEHPDVSPVACAALLDRQAAAEFCAGFGKTIDALGRVPCFWWADDVYTSYAIGWMLSYLQLVDPLKERLAQMLPRIDGHTTTFQASLIGLAALYLGHPEAGAAAADHLLALQGEDGLWPGTATLQVVSTDCGELWHRQGRSRGTNFRDQAGVFTSALCVRLLAHLNSQSQEPCPVRLPQVSCPRTDVGQQQ
jgi:hypothetical protein